MSFSAAIFWPAFKQAGMLEEGVYQPDTGPAIKFDVSFSRPDQVVLDGMVHNTDYNIEYQSGDIEIRRGYVVRIDGDDYKVRQTPVAKGDGTFVVASLEKVAS